MVCGAWWCAVRGGVRCLPLPPAVRRLSVPGALGLSLTGHPHSCRRPPPLSAWRSRAPARRRSLCGVRSFGRVCGRERAWVGVGAWWWWLCVLSCSRVQHQRLGAEKVSVALAGCCRQRARMFLPRASSACSASTSGPRFGRSGRLARLCCGEGAWPGDGVWPVCALVPDMAGVGSMAFSADFGPVMV